MAVTYRFEVRTESMLGVEELFDRARSVDMHIESMSGSNETVLGLVENDLLGPDQVVTWRARHFGVWWTMSSRITEMDSPHRFTDEQVKGPFKSFRHVHMFAGCDETTTMIDHVEFRAPFGFFGSITERAVLGRYLRRMIQARADTLARADRG